jgi:hypothetical protein
LLSAGCHFLEMSAGQGQAWNDAMNDFLAVFSPSAAVAFGLPH